jgi:hypothetical protein
MRKRNKRVHVYFNEEENAILCDLSKRTKLPKAVILRHMIMNCEVIPAPKIDYETHIRDLREVGNKFNDILLTARTKGFMNPKEVQKACDELQIIEDNMFKEIRSVPHNN